MNVNYFLLAQNKENTRTQNSRNLLSYHSIEKHGNQVHVQTTYTQHTDRYKKKKKPIQHLFGHAYLLNFNWNLIIRLCTTSCQTAISSAHMPLCAPFIFILNNPTRNRSQIKLMVEISKPIHSRKKAPIKCSISKWAFCFRFLVLKIDTFATNFW